MPNYPYPKKLQNFVFWWFYVRLGLVYNILKIGQNRSMGKCLIRSKIKVKVDYIGQLEKSFKVCRVRYQNDALDIHKPFL